MVETGLTGQQVVLEAKNYWHKIPMTTRQNLDTPYTGQPPMRGFTAHDALKKVERDGYPGDPFWEIADWDQLEHDLVEAIDADLKPESSYGQEMRYRDRTEARPLSR
jgi:hypothetical protein